MNQSGPIRVAIYKAVHANIDYPSILASLENEMVNLVTETLWQMERISELQRKIRTVTEQIEQGLTDMTFPPQTRTAHWN